MAAKPDLSGWLREPGCLSTVNFKRMWIWIAIGGAAGSVLRYALGGVIQKTAAVAFPVGTLAVNVIGCFIIGLLTQHFLNLEPSPALRAGLITGLCGGFTTFSAFSIEIVGLLSGGEYPKAAAYILMSLTLSIAATIAGMGVARATV